ncbi:unnamed protein product [Mytilus edulis]|uniref:Uncharacterized protein n=1 Tax=Mytilus edulis TaxID=6550 RepID=A0A8S3RX89_MYTED|nr:unnamed protein product [Mytilus edulis]
MCPQLYCQSGQQDTRRRVSCGLSECDGTKTHKKRELFTMCPYSCTVRDVMWTTKTQEERIDHYVSLQLYCQTVLSESDVDNKDTRRENWSLCVPSVMNQQRHKKRELITTAVLSESDGQQRHKKRENCSLCPYSCQSVMWTTKTQEERIDHYVSLQLYCQSVMWTTKTQEERIVHYVSLQLYCQSVMWTTKTQEERLITMCPAVLSECGMWTTKTQEERIDHYVSVLSV